MLIILTNTIEYYKSFLKKKKLVKRSKIITQQPKTMKNPNIINIKSINIEHPKIYIVKQQKLIFYDEEKTVQDTKRTKQSPS